MYTYAGLPERTQHNSDEYKRATKEIEVTTMVGLGLTFCEFVFLGLGWTLPYLKINVV